MPSVSSYKKKEPIPLYLINKVVLIGQKEVFIVHSMRKVRRGLIKKKIYNRNIRSAIGQIEEGQKEEQQKEGSKWIERGMERK